MKIKLYYLLLLCSLIGCYTYKPYNAHEDIKPETRQAPQKSNDLLDRVRTNTALQPTESIDSRKPKIAKDKKPAPKEEGIKGKLATNKFYKIEVADKWYKIQVDKWENDTLISHIIHHPKRKLKFHKNQINEESIEERRFSQPTSDIITVVAYAAIGLGIFLILQ